MSISLLNFYSCNDHTCCTVVVLLIEVDFVWIYFLPGKVLNDWSFLGDVIGCRVIVLTSSIDSTFWSYFLYLFTSSSLLLKILYDFFGDRIFDGLFVIGLVFSLDISLLPFPLTFTFPFIWVLSFDTEVLL